MGHRKDEHVLLVVMPNTWRVPANVVPICPDCQEDLTVVCSWPSRGAWGYDEVRTYVISSV